MATLPQCARRIVIATEYMGIPIRIPAETPNDGASLIWTLRQSFVNQGRLNREIIQLGYEPGDADICPAIDIDGLYIMVMVDCL